MKRGLVYGILLVLLASTLFWLLAPIYIRNAIIYTFPGIYDYRIFHSRVVENAAPSPWPSAINHNNATLPGTLADSLDMMGTTAFIVMQNDSLLYEYYGENVIDTQVSNSFSVAKGIVALVTGRALADGYISHLDQTVDEFLPDYPNLIGKGLTIRHLLTMSSGSDWDEDYNSLFSKTTMAYYGDDLPALMKQVNIQDTPGKIFEYKSGDTQLLGLVLSRATGMTLSAYFSETIWQVIGAENNGIWSLDSEDGVEMAYCCFNSHARDFTRLGRLVLDRGAWNGKQIVPAWFIDEMTKPDTSLVDKRGNINSYHGFKWWVMNYKGMTIPYTRGILGQYIFVIPEKNAVVTRLGHERSDNQIDEHPADAYTWINLALEVISQNN